MALQKQPIDIPFAQGLDQKMDPKRLQIGKFKELVNSTFNKTGLLTKRNGYKFLPSITGVRSLTTYKSNLVALGDSLQVFNQDGQQWEDRGSITPISVSTTPLVRTATSQLTQDVAVAPNGLCCTIWQDADGTLYYQISDSATGQIIVNQTPVAPNSQQGRVFSLGAYFILTFNESTSGSHFQYIAIPTTNVQQPGNAVDLSTTISSVTAAYDGFVCNNTLFLAYETSSGVSVSFLTSILVQGLVESTQFTGKSADSISVTADQTATSPVIWVSAMSNTGSPSSSTFSQAYNVSLIPIGSLIASQSGAYMIQNITSAAFNQQMYLYYEIEKVMPYGNLPIKSDVVHYSIISQSGTVGTETLLLNGVGLGSKAIYLPVKNTIYLLLAYGQSFQPTYFLVDMNANIVAKLAYSNGGGYITTQILPQINITEDEIIRIGYLYVDQIVAVNKSQNAARVPGVYAQTGVNIATFEFGVKTNSVEIGSNLHLTGGYMSMYDGNKPVEHQFHVWPEDVAVDTDTTGGNLSAQIYQYQVTYEWTDAQGNIHRSAPSVPVTILTTGTTSVNLVHVPMLRLTAKDMVRIVLYRWSTAQQEFFQVTTVAAPNINDPTAPTQSITITDGAADADIDGNNLIYTTGGVIEDIAAPSTNIFTLFKSRLFLVDAEDTNLIWYSKQVIESTPVEMSDLLTLYIAPTVGAQGSTGPITALSAMDDKLIIFKEDAIYYIVGSGPDNTGANNDFSDPIFITSTVGCANTQSIVMTPLGLMFQSNKGIWLLGRDLNTSYIGSNVENFNSIVVNSALTIPATNQVRFTLDGGNALVYDYYYSQWSEFKNMPAISATVYQDLHTYLDSYARIAQETINKYVDGDAPVLMNFTTSPIAIAGIQGYQRAYFFYLLGTFLSPHKMYVQIAYDYGQVSDSFTITPNNTTTAWGEESVWGSSGTWGGSGSLEPWRVFLTHMKCSSFEISIQESYDPGPGIAPGAGFTLSGINAIVGVKKGYTTIRASNSVG